MRWLMRIRLKYTNGIVVYSQYIKSVWRKHSQLTAEELCKTEKKKAKIQREKWAKV